MRKEPAWPLPECTPCSHSWRPGGCISTGSGLRLLSMCLLAEASLGVMNHQEPGAQRPFPGAPGVLGLEYITFEYGAAERPPLAVRVRVHVPALLFNVWDLLHPRGKCRGWTRIRVSNQNPSYPNLPGTPLHMGRNGMGHGCNWILRLCSL